LQPAVAALHAQRGQRGQQLPAVTVAAQLWPHVQVLQVDAVLALPGGEVQEPEREPGDLALVLGDMREDGRLGSEQGGAQLVLRPGHLRQRSLVPGQVADELVDRGHIIGPGPADHRAGRGTANR
jgi:hypothetical protein